MALDKIDADGLTNTQWKDVINGGIDAIEDNTMMNQTTINVTSTGSNPADVSVSMTGHVTTSSPLTGSTAIRDAIALLPRNLDRHRAEFIFGGTEGNPQTIAINKELYFNGFTGYLILRTKDTNDLNQIGTKETSKTNTLELVDGENSGSGASILDFFACHKVAISGLKLKYSNTSCDESQFAILASTCSFVDVANCNIEGHRNTLNSSLKASSAILSQQGTVTRFRDGYIDNFYYGLHANNTARIFGINVGTISTAVRYGMLTGNGSIGQPATNFSPTTTTGRFLKDTTGSLIVDEEGLDFEREILTKTKTVTIPAGSTVSEITQIFRNLPHNLNGRSLTVKFTSGSDASNPEVYDFGSDTLYIRGFHGGDLIITTTAGSGEDDQRVLIKGNPAQWKGVVNFDDCLNATLRNIRVETYGTNPTGVGMESVRVSSSVVHCDTCKFTRGGQYLHSAGIRSNHALNVRVLDCKFEAFHYAVVADHQSSAFHLENCQSVGLRGGYGLVAYKGSILSESGVTKVTSQLGNKVASGGLITQNAGIILNERIAQSSRRFKIAAADTPSDYIYRDGSNNNLGALSTADVVYSRNTITGAVLSGGTVTITTSSAHGYDPNADGSYRVYISSLGYTGVDPNGSRRVLSAPTPTTFTFALTGADETFTTSGATVSNIDMVKQLIGDATKVMNGYDVQFYFASGTYDWGFGTLNFKGFNGGTLGVYGHMQDSNSSLTTIMKTKDTNQNGVFMFEKSSRCTLQKMAFIQYGTNDDCNVVEAAFSAYLVVRNCTFVNENTKANDALIAYDAKLRVEETTFSNFDRNVVLTDFSQGYMRNTVTATSGVDANHHIRVSNGSNMRTSGSQASFSGNERESGGTIFNSLGNIV
tara:strand:- start:493 stop:3120 length:2628 start_codon:yes stop_codon:yes gene_type:complete